MGFQICSTALQTYRKKPKNGSSSSGSSCCVSPASDAGKRHHSDTQISDEEGKFFFGMLKTLKAGFFDSGSRLPMLIHLLPVNHVHRIYIFSALTCMLTMRTMCLKILAAAYQYLVFIFVCVCVFWCLSFTLPFAIQMT